MDQRLVELAELQARLGGPGWLRRLSIDVFEDPACPPGRLIYLPEQARLIVRVRWELEWQLHLLELDREVRKIYDDMLVRLARFAGVPYERTLLRTSQRPRRPDHETGRAYDRVDPTGAVVHMPL